MSKARKVKIWVYTILRLFIVGAGVLSFLNGDWLNFGLSLLIFLLTFLTSILARRLSVHYPNLFELIMVVFIYASLYLGEIHSFYTRLWWWDVVLHMSASIIFGAIGFSLVYTLNKERAQVHLSPYFIAYFAFSFAVMIGGVWEIVEFGMDEIFGTNMQKSGLRDTMWDLIVDVIGAFIVSVVGYRYVKLGSDPIKSFFKKREG